MFDLFSQIKNKAQEHHVDSISKIVDDIIDQFTKVGYSLDLICLIVCWQIIVLEFCTSHHCYTVLLHM